MEFTTIHGPIQTTHNAVATGTGSTGNVVLLNAHGYNTAMVFHTATSGTAYATVRERTFANGTWSDFAVHPAPSGNSDWGLNVRTSAAATSAVSIFKGITPQVGIALVRTSGTHTVSALFLNT